MPNASKCNSFVDIYLVNWRQVLLWLYRVSAQAFEPNSRSKRMPQIKRLNSFFFFLCFYSFVLFVSLSAWCSNMRNRHRGRCKWERYTHTNTIVPVAWMLSATSIEIAQVGNYFFRFSVFIFFSLFFGSCL